MKIGIDTYLQAPEQYTMMFLVSTKDLCDATSADQYYKAST